MAQDQYQTFPKFTDDETGSETLGVLHTAVLGEPGFHPKSNSMLGHYAPSCCAPHFPPLSPTAQSQGRWFIP